MRYHCLSGRSIASSIVVRIVSEKGVLSGRLSVGIDSLVRCGWLCKVFNFATFYLHALLLDLARFTDTYVVIDIEIHFRHTHQRLFLKQFALSKGSLFV